MLITCSSCNSKYLVNSADLKPNGRTVRCIKCRHDWYQAPDFDEEDNESIIRSLPNNKKQEIDANINQNNATSVSNLPTTYVIDQKPSFINTFFLLFFILALFFCFWIIKNQNFNILLLINFYIQEFYFNLKLIINDLAKIVHQVIN